jgi:predicted phage terminase large subunit-like protein
LFADTAHKTGQHNDYTAIAAWGKGSDGKIYLLDLIRDKLEAPALKNTFLAFWNKWKFQSNRRIGVREAYIEDKASGIGLIQELRNTGIILIPVLRNKDKVSRAYSSSPSIQEGKVVLPLNAPFTRSFVQEHEDFSPLMAHRFDDQVDTTMDAIQVLLQSTKSIDYRSAL